MNGTTDISVLGASARLGGLFAGGRGTWSVAGRRTYADALTSLFTGNVFPYHFRDFHGRATYALPGNVRLALTGYAGRDVLDANLAEIESDSTAGRADEGQWAFDWGNSLVGVVISKELGTGVSVLGWRLGHSATLEQRFSTSAFSTLLDLGRGTLMERNEVRDFRLSGSVAARGASHDASIGYELATHRIRYGSGSPQTGTTEFDIVQRPVSAATWVDDLWRLSSQWLVEWGVRAEGLTRSEWAALSPRVSVKFFANPNLALSAGAGRVTQWLHSLAGDGPLRYFDVWIAADTLTPVATAWHWVVGAERRLGTAGSVRLESYVKRYDRVLEANWSEDPQQRGDELFTATGLSYGLDLLARWLPASGVAGWVAYSYGVSSRSRGGVRWVPGA